MVDFFLLLGVVAGRFRPPGLSVFLLEDGLSPTTFVKKLCGRQKMPQQVDKYNKKKTPKITLINNPKNIPADLRKIPQWVCWFWELGKTKWTKPPCDIHGRKMSHLDSNLTFKEAHKAHLESGGKLGIGFSLRDDDGICGVDLDGVLTKSGKIKKKVKKALKKSGLLSPDIYNEVSPSFNGLRFFGYGSPNTLGATKGSCVEVYDRKRYLTVTGVANGSAGAPLVNIEKMANKIGSLLGKKKHKIPVSRNQTFDKTDPETNQNYRMALHLIQHLSGLEYNDWLNIGMALHHESDGASYALRAWINWSSDFESFTGEDACREKWEGFDSNRDGGVFTLRSIRKRVAELDAEQTTFDNYDDAINYMNASFAVVQFTNKVRFLQFSSGYFYNKQDFLVLSGKYRYLVPGQNETMTYKPANTAWLCAPNMTHYSFVGFDPARKPLELGGGDFYNLYEGQRTINVGLAKKARKRKGGCGWDKLKHHIKVNVCGNDRDYYKFFMDWMANIVQNPGGQKVGTSIVMRGGKGVGKSMVMRWIGKIFGPHYARVSSSTHVTGRFNLFISRAVMMFADEAFFAGDKKGEQTLKSIITDKDCILEMKGVDAIQLKSYVNLVMASNSDWVIPATEDERRYFVLDVTKPAGDKYKFFAQMEKEMKCGGLDCLHQDLLSRDIDSICDLRNAPKTKALQDQIEYSWSNVIRFWADIYEKRTMINRRGIAATRKSDVHSLYIEYCQDMSLPTHARVGSRLFGRETNKMIPDFNKVAYHGRNKDKLNVEKLFTALNKLFGSENDP